MPAFFLISGYVNQYSFLHHKPSELIKRRTISSLVPWFTWTIIVKGVLVGNYDLLNPLWLCYHIDGGFWFLFVLWLITMVYGVARFFAERMDTQLKQTIVFTVLYGICMMLFAALALVFGPSFLGMKYTLYYMLFYYVGYMWSVYSKRLLQWRHEHECRTLVVAASFILYVILVSRFNFASGEDNLIGILLRGICSMTGCICFFSLVQISEEGTTGRMFSWLGTHSLEIYVIHLTLIHIFPCGDGMRLMTLQGMSACLLGTGLLAGISSAIAAILQKNVILRMLLCGKR